MAKKYIIYDKINNVLSKLVFSFIIISIIVQFGNSIKTVYVNDLNNTLMTTNKVDLNIIDIIPESGDIEFKIQNYKDLSNVNIYLNNKKISKRNNKVSLKVTNGDLLEFISKEKDIYLNIEHVSNNIKNLDENQVYNLNIGYNRPISIRIKD